MTTPRVALLIDGDNVSAVHAKSVMDVAKIHGDVVFSRVYINAGAGNGDWVGRGGIDVFVTGLGGNSSDFRLSFEAVELSLRGEHEAFAIASDDSDLAHIVRWLQERGHKVSVIGTTKMSAEIRDAGTSAHMFESIKIPGFGRVSQPKITPTAETLAIFVREMGAPVLMTDFGGRAKLKAGMNPKAFGGKNWSRVFAQHPDIFVLSGPDDKMVLSLVEDVESGSHEDAA